MNKFSTIQALTVVVLLGFGFKANAIPTLLFDGDMSFDASSSQLSVSTILTGSVDIVPAPTLLGSNLSFSATLDSVSSDAFFTNGFLSGVAGDDLTVIGGGPELLLSGEFLDLVMSGVNDSVIPGQNSGALDGVITATGGSLGGLFGTGDLIALQFNLNTVFSPGMFRQDFRGEIDGRIEGVPEPQILTLLGLGITLIGFARLRIKQ